LIEFLEELVVVFVEVQEQDIVVQAAEWAHTDAVD
jgi:hypothetical protein